MTREQAAIFLRLGIAQPAEGVVALHEAARALARTAGGLDLDGDLLAYCLGIYAICCAGGAGGGPPCASPCALTFQPAAIQVVEVAADHMAAEVSGAGLGRWALAAILLVLRAASDGRFCLRLVQRNLQTARGLQAPVLLQPLPGRVPSRLPALGYAGRR
jgi:hypothetical protein